MTQIPAGWYPDPDPDQSDAQAQRYWDGRQWTEHVHAPSEPSAPSEPAAPTYPGPAERPYGAVAYPASPSSPAGYPVSERPSREATPDGQPLAGWWHRLGAWAIDKVLLIPLTLILAAPWVRTIASAYSEVFGEAMRAAENGGVVAPDQTALLADLAGPLLAVSLISLLVNFVYTCGFLRWKAATPGKLLVGLRVRRREQPGPLGWGTVLRRWAGQFGYALVGYIPVLGGLSVLYPLLDGLWPLWDSKRQAVHDKIAGTNVVRSR